MFVMCERGAILDRLAAMEKAGAIVVNSRLRSETPIAIAWSSCSPNTTSRRRQLNRRHRRAPSADRRTALGSNATISTRRNPRTSCMRHRRRAGAKHCAGSPSAAFPFVVVQEHVRGDLVKFYGVANGSGEASDADWFEWFYHRDKGMLGHAFDAARLRRRAWRGGALGSRYSAATLSSVPTANRGDRPQCVAELRALPRSGRGGDCRSPRRALSAAAALVVSTWKASDPMNDTPSPKQRSHAKDDNATPRGTRPQIQGDVRARGRGDGAGLQSIALYSQIVGRSRAEGCTITDLDGNEYLDFIAGIAVGSLGHCHPHYVKRLKEQLDRVDVRQLHHREACAISRTDRAGVA